MTLKILCRTTTQTHAFKCAEQMRLGLKRHGLGIEIKSGNDFSLRADVHLIWGWHNERLIKSIMSRGERVLVMERAYVDDRFKWTSLGWDGLNGNADFCNRGMPSDRWNKHFAEHMSAEWHHRDSGYVLIMGQVSTDAAVKPFKIGSWYSSVALRAKELGAQAVFRRHPKGAINSGSSLKTLHGSMESALAGARCVVTYNSNSGVLAVLAGVPTIAVNSGSMVYDLVDHHFSLNPSTPDRTQWAHNIAYAQWLPEEISSGEAWAHIRMGLEHRERVA